MTNYRPINAIELVFYCRSENMSAMDVLKCLGPECRAQDRAPTLISELEASISRATAYTREHLEDPPEIRDWVWTQ